MGVPPITPEFATTTSADGYGSDAAEAVGLVKLIFP